MHWSLSWFLVIFFSFAIWKAGPFIINSNHQLESKEQSLLLLFMATTLGCTLLTASAIRRFGSEQVRREHYHYKSDLYEGFSVLWYEMLENAKKETGEVSIHLEASAFKARIALHSNLEVIQAFNQLFSTLENEVFTAPATNIAFENLLLAMRADLGHSNLYPLKTEIKKLFSPLNT